MRKRLKLLERLLVLQKSMVLIKEVYKATSQFSQKERYGLSSQIQRAAVSIPGYIA